MIRFRPSVCKLIAFMLCFAAMPALSAVHAEVSVTQSEYSAAVAGLLLEAEQSAKPSLLRKGGGEESRVVLVRISGGEPDLAGLSPQTVLAGPKGKYTLLFATAEEARAAAACLETQDNVLYAEQDAPVYACETPLYAPGEYSFHSWAAERLGFPTLLDRAGEEASGSVLVGVVDSGLAEHPMLTARVDRTGYDYVDSDWDPTNDESGHGTHVAGIIVDCTPGLSVRLMPIRVLNANGGGRIANVANAIDEAVEAGCSIINLSLVSKTISEAFDDAVNRAVASGVTVVTAAGNNAVDAAEYSPVHLQTSGLIVVGAVNSNGSRSSYSNYGASVDVYAYGTGVQSCAVDGGYMNRNGTSMAAPHMTAACAILKLLQIASGPASCESVLVSVCPDPSLPVPLLSGLVPAEVGMTAEALTLCVGDQLQLRTQALPATCMLTLAWSSSDDQVLSVENNVLTAVSAGDAVLSVQFAQQALQCAIHVAGAEELASLTLPAGTEAVEEEAFAGLPGIQLVRIGSGLSVIGDQAFGDCPSLQTVFLPASVTDIGLSPFSSAALVVPENSAAYAWAMENDQPCIVDAAQ